MSGYDCTGLGAEGIAKPDLLMQRRRALVAVAAMGALFHANGHAAASPPQELRAWLPAARLSGNTRFSYWGFAVYDASLWVQAGFDPQQFESHGFALQLDYLRDLTNATITRSSIEEMARQSPPTPARRQLWQQWLGDAFPDLNAGDRITGVHRPGKGVLFLTNGRETGNVADAAFARLFFGIWLATSTSQPAMRQALLANTA